MTRPERILVVAHGHPELRRGGAEMVAGHLFRGLRARNVDAMLLAHTSEPSHGGSAFSLRHGDREILFHTGMSDYFNFRSQVAEHVWRDFAGLLDRFQPDVIHFQHYVHMGIELIRQARVSRPDARIVLTLHEYLPICAQQGQMVRARSLALCERSSPDDCARCFPRRSPAEFFLRERYLKSMLEDVDLFISPSEFLRHRYIEWGLNGDDIMVLENGQPETPRLPPRELGPGEGRNRFAFFGQLNRYKGVDLLLQAAASLKADGGPAFQVDVHGAHLEQQDDAFRERVQKLAGALPDTVTLHGEYDPADLGRLMASVDWVIVPSIWWENSPMVIQEAYNHGRPVIAANIGGMAEKVREGAGGLPFRARDARALADVMATAMSDPSVFDRAHGSLPRPPTVQQWIEDQLAAYATAR